MSPRPAHLVGAVVAYNVIQNKWLNDRGYVAANAAATTGAICWAWASGASWKEIGLDPHDAPRGLAVGAAVSLVTIGLLTRIAETDKARRLLDDRRLDDFSRQQAAYRVAVRFPVGTALFEEVVFRGVLPQAFPFRTASRRDLAAASVFALWHLIPTASALRANPASEDMSSVRKTAAIVGGSLASGLAGLGFSILRRQSSSVVAPWLVHASYNATAFIVAQRLRKR